MKTYSFTAAAVAVVAFLGQFTNAQLRKVETAYGALLEDGSRELMTYTVIFEECVGLTVDACNAIIQAHVLSKPEIFEGRTSLNPVVTKIRETNDSDYYKLALRTNLAETAVVGIKGDGMIYYPWDWCTLESNGEVNCHPIGPWDCDIGVSLTVAQCCDMIKASVPTADVNGNSLTCHIDSPLGSVKNPIDLGRVLISTNSNGIVVRPPKNQ